MRWIPGLGSSTQRRVGSGVLPLMAGRVQAAVVVVAVLVGCGKQPLPPPAAPLSHAPEPELPGQLYDDPKLARYVRDGARCVAKAANVSWPEVLVLDEAEVGAWALPGDRIAVTRGLLVHLRSEAELQAVLAHEVAHLQSGHVPDEEATEHEVTSVLAVPTLLVHAVREAAHSRAQEREADRKGIEYLEACGRSAQAMAELFETLEGLGEEDGSRFFATHPTTRSRRQLAHAQARAQASPHIHDPGRQAYLQAISGVIVGEDPRAGFVLDRTFYAPKLDLSAPLPRGWTSAVKDGVLLLQTPDEDAFVLLAPADPADPRTRVQDLLATAGVAAGEVTSVAVGEVQVTSAPFAVGEAAGVIAYLERDPVHLFLFGITPRDGWELFTGDVWHLVTGIDHIEDDALRSVSPLRLHLVELDREATLAEVADRFASDVTVAELARLNGVPPDTPLPAGTPLKRVVGFNPALSHRATDLDADDGFDLAGARLRLR